jgi:putative peptidoglycan lipid II flippase
MSKTSLLGSGLLLSLALMAGRLTGFFREVMLAATFGMSVEADMAIVFLTLPDLLVNLLLSGGLSVALIPAMRQTSPAERSTLFLQSSLVVFILFSIFGLVFALLPQWWFNIIAPGMSIQSDALQFWAFLLLAIGIPITGLSGVTNAALNAENRFFMAGLGTLLFNVCVIGALFWAAATKSNALSLLCIGIALGAVVRWGSQLLELLNIHNWSFALRNERWLITRGLVKNFVSGLTAASLLILVPVAIRAAASWLGAGQLAIFNYAIKLVELPLGILITTLATVAYPSLSQAFVEKNEEFFNNVLKDAFSKSMVISVSVVICGLQFSDAAVELLLGFGRVTEEQRLEVSSLTQMAMMSVPCIGVVSLMTAALNARGHSRQVLQCNFWALIALPVFMIPGLMSQSGIVLMAALPVFYISLCFLFCQKTSWKSYFPTSSQSLRVFAVVGLVFIPFYSVDSWLQSGFFGVEKIHSAARLLCALFALAMMTHFGLKAARRSPVGSL